jgi:hypothetical protein
MLISKREAAGMLGDLGLSRRHAEQVLDAGLAGVPAPSSASWLYDLDQVELLSRRPLVKEADAAAACPHGLFVARGPAALVDASRWSMSHLTRLYLRICLAQHGPVPLVVTVGGFVARAADITAVHAADSRALAPTVFTLDPAGAWFDTFRDHRHPTGPGKSWLLQGRHRHGHGGR